MCKFRKMPIKNMVDQFVHDAYRRTDPLRRVTFFMCGFYNAGQRIVFISCVNEKRPRIACAALCDALCSWMRQS